MDQFDPHTEGFLKEAADQGLNTDLYRGVLLEYEKQAVEFERAVQRGERMDPAFRVKLAHEFMSGHLALQKHAVVKSAEGFDLAKLLASLKDAFGGASMDLGKMLGGGADGGLGGGLLGAGGGLMSGLLLAKLFGLEPTQGLLLSTLLSGAGGYFGNRAGMQMNPGASRSPASLSPEVQALLNQRIEVPKLSLRGPTPENDLSTMSLRGPTLENDPSTISWQGPTSWPAARVYPPLPPEGRSPASSTNIEAALNALADPPSSGPSSSPSPAEIAAYEAAQAPGLSAAVRAALPSNVQPLVDPLRPNAAQFAQPPFAAPQVSLHGWPNQRTPPVPTPRPPRPVTSSLAPINPSPLLLGNPGPRSQWGSAAPASPRTASPAPLPFSPSWLPARTQPVNPYARSGLIQTR